MIDYGSEMSPARKSRVADIGSSQADLDVSTDRYANRFRGQGGGRLLSRQPAGWRRLVGHDKEASVLDIGGDHGQVAATLLADGHAVTVHASSEAALGQVHQSADPKLSLSIGSLMALPFPDRSFGLVTSLRIMVHIGDWRGYLADSPSWRGSYSGP